MSEIVSADWVRKLVDATFGGSAPDAVGPFLDAEVIAAHIGGSKLGAVFPLGGGPARVRVAHDGESERLAEAAKAAFPAAAAWVDAHTGHDVLYETDGTAARFLATWEDGDTMHGAVWQDGAEGTLTMSEALPSDAPAAAGAFAPKVDGGLWITIAVGDASSVVWTAEGDHDPSVEAAVLALGTTEALSAAKAVYDGVGLAVHPYAVEFFSDGTTTVCLWGAHVLPGATDDLPGVFAGGAPSDAEFAAELATVFPEDARADATAVLTNDLLPTIENLKPGERPALYRFLLDELAQVVPYERFAKLKRIATVHRLATMQVEALALALGRYLQSHPDAPASDAVPAHVAAMDVDALSTRAAELTRELAAFDAAAEDGIDVDKPRFADLEFERDIIRDMLARTVSGEFSGATGPLHEYLLSLGATGYDDDESLVALEDVDLEADRDAAIEEALAMDLDDDDDLG